jgi:hypothetical protein
VKRIIIRADGLVGCGRDGGSGCSGGSGGGSSGGGRQRWRRSGWEENGREWAEGGSGAGSVCVWRGMMISRQEAGAGGATGGGSEGAS